MPVGIEERLHVAYIGRRGLHNFQRLCWGTHGDKETRRRLAVNLFVVPMPVMIGEPRPGTLLMDTSLHDILASYNDRSPLEQAHTIPASWYVDARVAELERQNVFGRTGQVVARVDQVQRPGQYVTADLVGEPLVVVRGNDRQLRAFYNVCRHHAAAVVTEAQGTASILRCPYHGWSYGLAGSLKGAPEFEGVCSFDRAQNGLLLVRVETWEQFVLVNLDPKAAPLADFLGRLVQRVAPLDLGSMHFFERRSRSEEHTSELQ